MLTLDSWYVFYPSPKSNLDSGRAVGCGNSHQHLVSGERNLPHAWRIGVIGVKGELILAVAARRPDTSVQCVRFARCPIEKPAGNLAVTREFQPQASFAPR